MQMSSRNRSNQARARALRSSSSAVSIGFPCARPFGVSGLWPEIGAALMAGVAVDAAAGDGADMLEALIDEAREVLERRQSDRLDLVEKLVIEHLLGLRHRGRQQPQ